MGEHFILKNTVLKVKEYQIILTSDAHISKENYNYGYFILDLYQMCSYKDINTLPALFIECQDDCDVYELKKHNIILGKAGDICLNLTSKKNTK